MTKEFIDVSDTRKNLVVEIDSTVLHQAWTPVDGNPRRPQLCRHGAVPTEALLPQSAWFSGRHE